MNRWMDGWMDLKRGAGTSLKDGSTQDRWRER